MKDFHCKCGARVFFRNTHCLNCSRLLGFDPHTLNMRALDLAEGGGIKSGQGFKFCKNHSDYNACNWLLHEGDSEVYCLSCRLNRTVPDLSKPDNITRWIKLEAAKRHLIYSLLMLDLEVTPAKDQPVVLAFDFLEDSRTNPDAAESFIATGHSSGLITINLAEADDVYRESVREGLGEHYRTILGHFRHEIGHYYYEVLIANSAWSDAFARVFGDPMQDYDQSLEAYYQRDHSNGWQDRFISSYAQAHPLEDWAETWAHYLHILDTLDTAVSFKMAPELAKLGQVNADEALQLWSDLSVKLNALNRSMGLADAYPFVITDAIADKLKLIHQVINNRPSSVRAVGQRLR